MRRIIAAAVALVGAAATVLASTPAARATAPPTTTTTTTLPNARMVQGYTSDPRYVNTPGAIYQDLKQGLPLERVGGGTAADHRQIPKNMADAERIAAAAKDTYTADADADAYTGSRTRFASPFNWQTCRDNQDKSGATGGWVRDHFAYCQAGKTWAQVWYGACPGPDCKDSYIEAKVWVVGYGKAGAVPGSNDDRYVEFQQRVTEFNYAGADKGELWKRYPTTLAMKMECKAVPGSTGACNEGNRNGRTATVDEWVAADGFTESQFVSPAKTASAANGEQLVRAVANPWYSFAVGGYTPAPEFTRGGETGVRFDSAWYMYKVAKKGSIFDRVAPFIAFSNRADSGYKIAADHLQKALTRPGETKPPFTDKQIPGSAASDPLHRLYKGISEKNRLRYNRNYQEAVKACNQWFPGWQTQNDTDGKKKQCDEFPFRSTYEGVARSMTDYENDLGGAKYANMFSVQPLSGPQNVAAGGLLCRFYSDDRILNMDAFHVKVRAPETVLPNKAALAPKATAQDPTDPDDPDEITCGNADGT
ncbi:NucA/NucB deoxyribonuclease domain-containing protein [Actinomadura harenae]|uniref:NucA/NucB deoxyribonuclease domain-containing protein n=1 Tax=Actinomadura harenae TaxID=2483351 RepID=UPI0018F4A7FD|nr:hypothetical protein [Actinomadura harenae]